jgi:hypothetical protein
MRAWNSSLSIFNPVAMSLRVLTGADNRAFILSYREFHELWIRILYAGVREKIHCIHGIF